MNIPIFIMSIATSRIRLLNNCSDTTGAVAYWMSRDQRVQDNWALLYAQYLAKIYKQPLVVFFSLVPQFAEATWRQYSFMLTGLKEVAAELDQLQIPFHLLLGAPQDTIPRFVADHNIGTLVTDFSPLKIYLIWKQKITKQITIPFYEVDTHNIVPCWNVSAKQEFGAYTLRPKLDRQLKTFLVEFPSVEKHSLNVPYIKPPLNWKAAENSLTIDYSIKPVQWCLPGTKAGLMQIDLFLREKLGNFIEHRNDPNAASQSSLSPYLHFGQIAAQRVALKINKSHYADEVKAAFLEELIVRRELADNYCFYNKNYDSFAGFPAWAQATLNDHRLDHRTFIYQLADFEQAHTHDALWNACQLEMLSTGKMHGYMRMYWAKKILEWTASPEEAQKIAIYLNDKYELDGRDPNGYTGIAWSIGGVHDRAWFQRPIFGKIRYMNASGCARKFNVEEYITQYS